MTISPAQCRAGRALIGWSRDDLAAAAGVGKRTIVDFERDARSPQASTVLALRIAFEAAGVAFLAENGGGAGVRLAKPRAGHEAS
ncbi:MAG: helix-turn-helix transcriptional regulator [Albimonas sp.]|uniref:helix-turn-helix transcriptional regulator n=1 Tax=Albimonas sp. TaxID=1872425 RepID=UPI004057CACE